MEIAQIRRQLAEMSEPEFKKFSAGLLPGVSNMLGVRLPALRKLARQIARADWQKFLQQAEDQTFEETMLQGMVIGCAKMGAWERVEHIQRFVPKINNWSVCDSFCCGLKAVKREPDVFWPLCLDYCQWEEEFFARFGVVMLLDHFIDELHVRDVLTAMDAVSATGYYARMAVAWAVSVCMAKFPEITLAYLGKSRLDDATYHKALQKSWESYRVSQAHKAILRGMRR